MRTYGKMSVGLLLDLGATKKVRTSKSLTESVFFQRSFSVLRLKKVVNICLQLVWFTGVLLL